VLRIVTGGGQLAYRSAQLQAWLLSASAPRYFLENTLLWLWPWGRFGVLWVDDPNAHAVANVLCWALLLAALALLWRLRQRDRALAFGLAWFGLLLRPLCNLIPLGNTPVAEHYLYLPSIGLALALCRAFTLAVARATAHAAQQRRMCAALALAACLALLAEARVVAAAFGDDERLYALSHANHPDNVEVLVNLARIQLDRGKVELARRTLDEAARLAPVDHRVLRNRYALLLRTGQPEAALAVTELPPVRDLPEFMIRRGELLLRLGRHAEARAAFELAFERATDRSERLSAGYQLVIALLSEEQLARARPLVERLLTEYPGQPELVQARALLRSLRP